MAYRMEITKEEVLKKIELTKSTKYDLGVGIINAKGNLPDPNKFSEFPSAIHRLQKPRGNLKLMLPSYIDSGSYKRSIFEIDTSSWPGGQVSSMGSMFDGFTSLSKVDLSMFDVSNCTSFYKTFENCQSIIYIEFPGWKAGKVLRADHMFRNCYSVTRLDLSWMSFGSNGADLDSMFYGCWGLEYLDISNFNMICVNYVRYMFYGCKKLSNIIWPNNFTLSGYDTTLQLNDCPLTKASVLDLFNKLKSVTSKREIQLGAAVYDGLSPDNLKIATDKGWTICRGLGL